MLDQDQVPGGKSEAAAPHRKPCRLMRGSEPSTGLTGEMVCLLRTRMRVAVLIILGAMALHLVRDLSDSAATLLGGSMGLVLRVCAIAALAALAAVLWSSWPLSMKRLRLLELAVFGITAAFIAWLHFEFFRSGVLDSSAADGASAVVRRLAGGYNVFRWLLLIILYGMFIPNTWRRCAAVVGCMALPPVLLTLSLPLFGSDAGSYVGLLLPDTVILMIIATAAAVFGSHKVRELHEKVHEAQEFGRYRLKAKLGAGGMGEVYLAEHILLRRPCAIKLILPSQAGDPKTLLRFEREVRVTATLTHWNTVEIFDYGHAEDGTFYYVMEYLPGLNLDELVARHGPLPPERVVHLLRQVCDALREAHSIGLIHRDIKPSNVLACERGKVPDVAKLLDFGLVKSFGMHDGINITQEGTLAGSPAFMSPEQAAGRPIDARSDIYNVGAMAYYLLTGHLIFERDTPLEMLHAHAFEPLKPTAVFQGAAPPDLQAVIVRCLEKDPALRYQDVDALEKAFAACACAGQWTRDRAQAWWRDVPASPPPTAAEAKMHVEAPTLLSPPA